MMQQALIGMAMSNPGATMNLGRAAALRAVGATDADLAHTTTFGIPPYILVGLSLALGGVLCVRYLPESWQNKIRRFGK